MKIIVLTQNKFSLVDDEDVEKLNKYKWSVHTDGYAVRGILDKDYYYKNNRKKKILTIYMHRFVMNTPKNMEIDHINGNRLDNRKSNLRIVTRFQNKMNHRLYKNNTSGYSGVVWDKQRQSWKATISSNNEILFQKLFKDKQDAINKRQQLEIEYFGDFRNKNYVYNIL